MIKQEITILHFCEEKSSITPFLHFQILGDMTLHPSEVSQPEGHYTETYKPSGFDVCQVFVSPSIKYCTDGEVYAKSYRYDTVHLRNYGIQTDCLGSFLESGIGTCSCMYL